MKLKVANIIIKSKRYIKIRNNLCSCLRCGTKTLTVLFWAFVYIIAMKMTYFKNNNNIVLDVKGSDQIKKNQSDLQFQEVSPDWEKSQYLEETLESYEETEKKLENRSRLLNQMCTLKGLDDQQLNSKEFFINRQHKLVWCNVFKAASTSWLYNFNVLGGLKKNILVSSHLDSLKLARQLYPRPKQAELYEALHTPQTESLIVVRDPFIRLLSAYRDKLERIGIPYYKAKAKFIIKHYREKNITNNKNSIRPSFKEFVRYLIDYEGDVSSLDEHWVPYFSFCTPCAAKFTLIAKLETFKKDTNFIIRKLGLDNLLGKEELDKRTKLRNVINKSRDGKNTARLVGKYYGEIDRNTLEELLEIYGLDFDLFGYDKSVYYKYVKK